MAMREDDAVGVELNQKVDNFVRAVHRQHRQFQMLEIAQRKPAGIALIKGKARGRCVHGRTPCFSGWDEFIGAGRA